MTRALLVLLTLTAGAGCAENAILKLTLSLPAESAEPAFRDAAFAVVTAESGEVPVGEDSRQEALALPREDPASLRLSVVAPGGEALTQALFVRVRFCPESCVGTRDCIPSCVEGRDPEVMLRFERAFYRARETEYTYGFRVEDLGGEAAPVEIGRCAVHGCRAGEPPTTGSCDLDGAHFCER